MTSITIIGAGVSGVFLTIQLIRNGHDRPLSITLIEKEKEPWLGVAYSTDKPFHLLNVRASKMSALAGEENHFLSWLTENNYSLHADDFAQRSIYRKYVKDVFQNTLANKPANIKFKFIHEEVVDIKQANEHEAVVHLQNKQTVVSNFIVLALGNFTSNSALTENPSLHANSAYYDNPWAQHILDNLKKDAAVLILGTGPTMIDAVLALYHQRHEGKITAISRHGLIPAEHAIAKTYPDFSNEMEKITSLTDAVRIVRKHIALAEEQGIGWRAVIDSMRPFTRKWWLNISLQGKIDFLKYYKTYWEVSRSRMPEEYATVIKEMIDSGLLYVVPGRIRDFEKQNAQIEVKFTNTKNGSTHVITADAVINCMGPGLNFEKIKHPLIESLVKQGLICNSPASCGVNALPDGEIIKRDGTPSKLMYTLGSPLRGILWETIAIPEISMQARDLALLVLEKVIH